MDGKGLLTGDCVVILRIAVLMLALIPAGLSFAGERPACYQFYYRAEAMSEAELKQIGADCPLSELGELYRNRADYLGLLKQYAKPGTTRYFPSSDFQRYIEGYRINIALLELFASHYQGNLKDLIGEMNQGYREAIELARLRLGSVGWRVEWLNWFRSRQNSRRDRLGTPP